MDAQMEVTGTLLDLVDYDAWAMQRIFDAAGRLDGEQLDVPVGNPDWTARSGLVHVVGTQAYWLQRIGGARTPEPQDGEALDAVRAAYARTHGELVHFLADQAADGLGEVAVAARPRRPALTRLDLVLHILVHSMHHRGELASLLTVLGCSPGDLDYVDYLRERGTNAVT